MAKARPEPDDVRMSIGEHLEDLRRRMVRALLGVGLAAAVTLYFGRPLIAWLCAPLNTAQRLAGLAPQTYSFGPAASFTVYLKVATLAALILATPWVLYQLWQFVALGLYKSERRVVLLLTPFSAAMCALGVLFMYYIMVPICLWFFITWSVTYPPVRDAEPTWMFKVLTQAKGLEWLGIAELEQGREAPTRLGDLTPGSSPGSSPASSPGSSPGSSPASSPVLLPMLAEDPANPVEGQIWLKKPQNELRLWVGGRVRSLPLTTATLMSPLIEINQYLQFVAVLTLGIVITFQTPVVMLIAAWSGLVRAATLARYRRHCVFICFVLGMFFTPSDALSMLVLAFPLWGLYELGLLLMRLVEKPAEAEGPPG